MRPSRHPYLGERHPLPLAHRGGSLEVPENSRAAFRHARHLGLRHVETDVRATADGVVLIHHDAVLDRTSDLVGRLEALPHAQVCHALVGGEPIMSLDEALDEFSDLALNIDCKDDHTVEPLIRTLRHRGEQVFDRVCIGSFSQRRLDGIREALGPRLATSCGPREVLSLMLAGRTRRTVRLHPGVIAAQVPLRMYRVPVVTPSFIDAAHRADIDVHVWTVDDAASMRALFAMGVDGIVSDRPTVLAAVIAERQADHA